MAFHHIRKDEFDQFQPPHLIFEMLMKQQVEWLASPTQDVIGTVAGTADTGWRFAVLERNPRGHFRIFKLGGSANGIDAARTQLIKEMELAEQAVQAAARDPKLAVRKP